MCSGFRDSKTVSFQIIRCSNQPELTDVCQLNLNGLDQAQSEITKSSEALWRMQCTQFSTVWGFKHFLTKLRDEVISSVGKHTLTYLESSEKRIAPGCTELPAKSTISSLNRNIFCLCFFFKDARYCKKNRRKVFFQPCNTCWISSSWMEVKTHPRWRYFLWLFGCSVAAVCKTVPRSFVLYSLPVPCLDFILLLHVT